MWGISAETNLLQIVLRDEVWFSNDDDYWLGTTVDLVWNIWTFDILFGHQIGYSLINSTKYKYNKLAKAGKMRQESFAANKFGPNWLLPNQKLHPKIKKIWMTIFESYV